MAQVTKDFSNRAEQLKPKEPTFSLQSPYFEPPDDNSTYDYDYGGSTSSRGRGGRRGGGRFKRGGGGGRK